MGEFVGDDIAQPVASAAQFVVVVEGSSPDFDHVVIKKSGAVGVVVIVFEHDAHFFARLVAVEFGNRPIGFLGDLRRALRRILQTLVIHHAKMIALDNLPL